MGSLEYLSEVLKFTAVPLALVELVPKARNEVLERYLIKKISYRLLKRIVLLAAAILTFLYLIPWVSPFIQIFCVLLANFAGRALLALKMDEGVMGIGCVFGVIETVLLLCLYFIFSIDPKLLAFWFPLVFALLYVLFRFILDEEGLITLGGVQLIWFFFAGLPLGLSFWLGPENIDYVLDKYQIFLSTSNSSWLSFLLPDWSNEEFKGIFEFSENTLKWMIPDFLEKWKPIRVFLEAHSGFLIITIFFLFLGLAYWIYTVLRFTTVGVLFVFVRTSIVARNLLKISDKTIFPIGGAIFFAIGETISFVLKTINFF